MVRKKLAMVRVPLDNKELDKVLDGVLPRSQVPVYDAFTELYESLAPMISSPSSYSGDAGAGNIFS